MTTIGRSGIAFTLPETSFVLAVNTNWRLSNSVEQQGTIEVRTFVNGSFSIVVDLAAPENDAAIIVGRLKFEPGVVCIDRAPREEVADFARSHDDVDQHVVAAADRRVCTIQRRR